MKKIAIIGSGFFGSTCALILSNFFKVDLFEKKIKFYVALLEQIK
tara:strand:- start:7 stop:141 length:135 start_codon:yes stop_codon:yes gene_type:complete